MFELNEAVRGRLIGPKTWDRIDIIFWNQNGAACDCSTAVWVDLSVHSCVNHVLIGLRPEIAGKCGFTR